MGLCFSVHPQAKSMAAQAQSKRWILKQPITGEIIKIRQLEETAVGRHRQARVCLLSSKVSRTHACLGFNDDGEVWLKDLGSANGTYVNGTRIEANELVLVHHGAKLGFGLPSITGSEGDRDDLIFYDLIQLPEKNDNGAGDQRTHKQVSAVVQNGGVLEFANIKEEIIEISDDEDIEENFKKSLDSRDDQSFEPQPSTSKNATSIMELEEKFESFDDDITKVSRKSKDKTENDLAIARKSNNVGKALTLEPQNDQEDEILQLPVEDICDDHKENNLSDDDDIKCSQIFLMPRPPEAVDFHKIKSEVSKMDYTVDNIILNSTPLSVDDEDRGFENTQALRDLLEDGLANSNSPTLPVPAPAGCSTITNLEPAKASARPIASLRRRSPRETPQFGTNLISPISRIEHKPNQVSAVVQNGEIFEFANNEDGIIDISGEEDVGNNLMTLEKGIRNIDDVNSYEPQPSTSKNGTSNIEMEERFASLLAEENDLSDDDDVRCSQIFQMSILPEPVDFQKIKTEMDEMNYTDDSVILNPIPLCVDDEDHGFENTQDLCDFLEDGLFTTPAEESNLEPAKAPASPVRRSPRFESPKLTDSTLCASPIKRKSCLDAPVPEKKKLKTVLISPKPIKSNRELKRKHRSTSADKGKATEKHASKEPKKNNRRSIEDDKGKKLKLDKQSTSSKSKAENAAKESKGRRKSAPEESKRGNSSRKHRRSSDKGKKPEPEKHLGKLAPGTSVLEDPRREHTPSIIEVSKAKKLTLEKPLTRSNSDTFNAQNVSMAIHSASCSTNGNGDYRPVDPRIPRLQLLPVDAPTFKLPTLAYKQNEVSVPGPQMTSQLSSLADFSRAINERQTRRTATSHNAIKLCNIDDITMKILRWDTSWLRYQMETISFEPRLNSTPAENIPCKFGEFRQYYSIFNRLILLETWESMFKTYLDLRQSQADVQPVIVEKKRLGTDFMYLDCQYEINAMQLQNVEYCKNEDLIMVEYQVERNSTMTFGLVQSSKISAKKLRSNKHLIVFSVMVPCDLSKYNNNTLKKVIIQRVANLRSQILLFKATKNLVKSRLCPMLLDPQSHDFKIEVTHKEIRVHPDKLNSQQKKIVLEAASLCTGDKPGVYTLIGPPGTGKTHIIVNIIFQIIFNHYFDKPTAKPPMILVVAPSNAAVDNLITKIVSIKKNLPPDYKRQVKCVRIGPLASIAPAARYYSLHSLAEQHVPVVHEMLPAIQEAKRRKENLIEFCKRYFGNDYPKQLRICENVILEKSNVILTTLGSCVSNARLTDAFRQHLISPTCCIIDEATQCNEPESLLPTLLGIDKIVMVGDPCQLNATVLSREATRLGFGDSLFSRLVKNFQNAHEMPMQMLTTQYRMHPEICSFPNQQFYGGALQSQPNPRNKLPDIIRPYLVFNCTNQVSQDDPEYTNVEEMRLIKNLLMTIIKVVNNRELHYTVGIITPYNAQKNLIHKNLKDIACENLNWEITINTVDSFQGSENDIVIISCVRDSTNSFLQNVNRLNVSLTRAKQALYIFGNATLFTECQPLYDLRQNARDRMVCLDISTKSQNIKDFSKYLCRR